MEFVYIKYDVPGNYVVLMEQLDPELYDNLGTTFDDYLNNNWVELNSEQIKFHADNPQATVQEVWDVQLKPPYQPTIEEVKADKIKELLMFDESSEVNGFTINNMLSAWFTPAERSNYKSSIEAAKLLHHTSLAFFVGDMMLEIQDIQLAEVMLAQIQLYADQCFLVTKQHQVNIMALETIEEVESYDYTVGYPEKLNFDLM